MKTVETKKTFSRNKALKLFKLLAGLVIGAALGFGGGLMIAGALPRGLGFGQMLLHTGAAAAVFLIGIPVQIILHEAGHLAFGLATGYRFVSFRIGALVLMRSGRRFQLKWMPMPGTGGQCLMAPPEGAAAGLPVALYNLGGVAANLITALLCAWAALYPGAAAGQWRALLAGIAFWGLWLAVFNGIPMKVAGIQNDARNLLDIRRNPASREAFFAVLRVNALLAQGVSPAKAGGALVQPPQDADASDALVAQVLLARYLHLLDAGDIPQALQVLSRLNAARDGMLPLLRTELDCELLYAHLMLREDIAAARALYTPQVKQYLNKMALMDKKRTLAACLLMLDQDRAAARAMCAKALSLEKRFALPGVVALEKRLIQAVMARCDAAAQESGAL